MPSSMKENKKGCSRSYYFRRKLVVLFCALAFAFILTFRISQWWKQWKSRLPPVANRLPLVAKEKFGSVADRPIRPISYGVQGTTPVVMIRTNLDGDVHARFLEEHLYSCEEGELNSIEELDNRVKPPVYVYEGYFHSLRRADQVYSKNPNPLIGKDFMKPAAGRFTRAFFDAFRHVNEEVFERLRQDLLRESSHDETAPSPREDVLYLLANWIERGHHFGDLSVQIHWGENNHQKLASGAAWHADAENSLLHLAVTLRGERVLHSRRKTRKSPSGAALRGPRGTGAVEVEERQTPGDVYLSSSTLMRHAPQFFDTDFSTRAIAIHARFLYTSAEVDRFRRARTKESWDRLTEIVAEALAAADIVVPSLRQVESQLSKMET